MTKRVPDLFARLCLYTRIALAAGFLCHLCLAQNTALPQNPVHTAASAGESSPSYTLKSQDVIGITFALTPELNQTATITPDGFVNLELVKSVYLENFTVPEATDAVKAAYVGVLHDPLVSIDVKSFQQPYFTILGQVGRPGKYDLRQRTSLAEAIAIAGGFATTARTQVLLVRRVSGETAEVIPYQLTDFLQGKSNAIEPVDLRSGDMIFVPEKFITKVKKYISYGGLSVSNLY